MASLPSDRTKLALAQSNQNPGNVLGSSQNKNALTETYDTIDLLNQKVDALVAASTLVPYPSSNLLRNGFINPNMEVAQRGTSFTIATGTSAYTVDRIKSINNGSGANATASQVAVSDLDGANFGLQLVHVALPSVGGQLMEIYTMEARDSYKYAGKTVVFQIKVKAVSGMNQATLKVRYKTTESAVADSSTLVLAGSVIPISSSIWTTLSITVTLPSRANLTTTGVFGFQIVGSKTTAEASGDGFIVTEWGLNEGTNVLPFQPRSFADELALCQRYYEKSGNYTDAIGTGFKINMTASQIANNKISSLLIYKVRKRAASMVTLYDNAGLLGSATWYIHGSTTLSLVSLASLNNEYGFQATSSATDSTAINNVSYAFTADSEL